MSLAIIFYFAMIDVILISNFERNMKVRRAES